jgi:hypothetical protein
MINLSKFSDIYRILYSLLTFNSEGMKDTKMPMKNSQLKDSKNVLKMFKIQKYVVDT